MSKDILVEVIADITCPWSYVGLLRLKRALQSRPQYNSTLKWRPFLINQEFLSGVIDRSTYLLKLYGTKSRVYQFHETLNTMLQHLNVDVSSEKLTFIPSSINAHRLIMSSNSIHKSLDIAERLFHLYFAERQNINDLDLLTDVALENDIPIEIIDKCKNTNEGIDDILQDSSRIQKIGISGVPSFAFNKTSVISGAQEESVFVHLLDFISCAEALENESIHIKTMSERL